MSTQRSGWPWVRVALVVLAAGAAATGFLASGLEGAPAAACTLVVGAGVTGLLLLAAVRGGPAVRLSWTLAALTVVLWTAFLNAALMEADGPWVWGGLRGAAFLASGAALLTSPGVRRPVREWGLLLLDGWMIGASAFAGAWVSLGFSGSSLGEAEAVATPALFLVPLNLVVASVCAGLAVRTAEDSRPQAVLLVLVSCQIAVADATWALTDSVLLGTAQWLAVFVLFGAVTVGGTLDIFGSAGPRRGRPRLGRVSQLAIVPGLLASIVVPATDPVLICVSASLLVALAFQLVLLHRQQERLHAELHEQAARLDRVLRDSRDAILQVDARGLVEFANEATAEVFGRPSAELVGRAVVDLLHPDDRSGAGRAAAGLDADAGAVRVAGRVLHADGTWHHLEATVSRRAPVPGDGAPGWTASTRDVTDRVRLEDELRHQAGTDALTGLTNRHAFLALVDERLRSDGAVVLFLDLDGFKTINDTDGHARGDAVLRRAARAVAGSLMPGDVAARLGGDEFAVLLGDGDGGPAPVGADLLDRGLTLAHRLVQALAVALPTVPGVLTGVSIGVAAAVADGAGSSPAEALLRDADLAMYEAKSRGGGCVVAFEEPMRERVLERTRRQAALEQAIGSCALQLHLQPVVALRDSSWVGFEALVRWQDGDRLRGPVEFIPLAEETGLIVPLGTWVLRTALQWLATWPDPRAGVAVNVAARQVADRGFGDLVRQALADSGVDPSRLTLEITEQTAVDDLTRAGAVLQPLRAQGVHVALDDFGTGFSSLGYLAQLPVDELKIDRRFVSGLGTRPQDEALVRAVIGLADDLGLRVVAEGVETPQQAAQLLALGCPWAQGYLFARPAPMDAVRPAAGDDVRPAGTGGAGRPGARAVEPAPS